MNIFCHVDSPIGSLLLRSDGPALTGLYMGTPSKRPPLDGDWRNDAGWPVLRATTQQLAEYFAGRRRKFDLPLRLQGTEFQQQVWSALTEIPFGETWSYGRLARHIGNASACRAVGLANGKNPIAVIVPCHRVIGSDGSLTGFGGGLPRKQWLLSHEGQPLTQQLDLGAAPNRAAPERAAPERAAPERAAFISSAASR